MTRVLLLIAVVTAALASPAQAVELSFDFSGTVLSQTRPTLSVTPQPITGSLQFTTPVGGNVATISGDATLFTNLYGNFFFSDYTATLSDMLFTFSGSEIDGQRFSLRATALPSGGFGVVSPADGFSLTGTPVNAAGRLSGSFAVAAVPEPASWLMLIIGFGVLGVTLRRRRKVTRFLSA